MAGRVSIVLNSLVEKLNRTKDMILPDSMDGLTEHQKGFVAGLEASVRIIEQTDPTA